MLGGSVAAPMPPPAERAKVAPESGSLLQFLAHFFKTRQEAKRKADDDDDEIAQTILRTVNRPLARTARSTTASESVQP